tara:strand:- start:45 stop:1940 length:1896 start_codon:yes stop_codon:yes gene_type:complete
MCGINGLVVFNSKVIHNPQRILKKMNASLRHRGPDNEGIWSKENVFIGHRRLSIIDLSKKSNQPMKVNNLILTFNGEIYNFLELRLFLKKKGMIFKTSGDTEVLINAYKYFGDDVCKHLNGMFAFGIYDENKKTFFFARDPSGQKPLYYFHNEDFFAFSSELKTIIQTKLYKFRLNIDALYQYMAYGHTINPNSIINNVYKLEPGSSFKLDLKSKKIYKNQYFKYKYKTASERSLEFYISKFKKVFSDSVKRHYRSDVQSAVYLSSGIDSTSILSQLSEDFSDINTITARFEESDYDESDYAKKVADIFCTNHTEFLIKKNDIFSSIFSILDRIDEPISDLGLIAIHQVAKCAKGDYKVVFSGDGGDELFFGYEPFIKYPLTKVIDFFPKFLISGFQKTFSTLFNDDFGYLGLKYKLRLFLNSHKIEHFKKNQCWSGSFSVNDLKQIFQKTVLNESLDEIIFKKTKELYKNSNFTNIEKLGSEYFNLFLPEIICSHTDKANMMESIEARSPFLDNEMINFALEVPEKFKVNLLRGKIIMRENLKKWDDLNFISNKKKKGYTVPMSQYFLEQNDLTEYFNDSINNPRNSNIFDYSYIKKLYSLHKNKRVNVGKELWNFLMIDNWLSKNRISL